MGGRPIIEGDIMRRCCLLSTAILSIALLETSVVAQDSPASQPSAQVIAKVVRVEGVVDGPVSEVWRVFTTSQGAEEFFAQKANIQLALGGPYEIQFDPKDELSGTEGLKILSYAPQEMISFQWNAPPELPAVRNGGTWVVVTMAPVDAHHTRVTIEHLGWKEGPQWDAAYGHFVEGWSGLMDRLKRRFSDGPIDWAKEPMMYQKAKH
jgi:uncharacterized protein YndB with AHSA1/START domain